MKQQRMRTLINMGLALLLVAVCLVSLPAPGVAHVVGGSSWSAPLPVAEESEATSELLTAEGQTIVLSLLEGSRDVTIAIDIPEDVYWYVTATTENTQDLWVSPYVEGVWTFLELEGVENTMFYQGGGAQNITVSLTNLLPTIYVAEGEEAPIVDAVSADVNVTLHYITAAEAALLQPQTTELEAQPVEVVEEESGETQDAEPSEETEGAESSEEVPVPEVPSPLHAISATLHVPLQEKSPAATLTGQLLQWPAQYHPTIAIPLVNGTLDSELKLLNGETFPAMTRYTMDGETYLLYDGGTINVPADAAIALDFSMVEEPVVEELPSEDLAEEEVVTDESTEIAPAEEAAEEATEETVEENESTQEQTLKLLVGGYEYSLTYAEAPVLDKTQAPFIMKGSTFVLPMTYQWNTIAPTVSVEQLKSDGEALVWEVMDADRWQAMDSETQLRLSAVGRPADAGTYRLTVTWAENEMTLYSLQTVFYVRSGNL